MSAAALFTFLYFMNPSPAGCVNHAEGEVIRASEKIETREGRAEILLTAGVFLRLDANSASTLGALPEVSKGRALIEASYVPKPVNLGGSVTLLSEGLYLWDADRNSLSLYQGKARVGKTIVHAGREIDLTTLTQSRFDKKATDALYGWSKRRSAALAVATRDAGRRIISERRLWDGAGWYCADAIREYVFLPSDGELRSPFGYWYQSPYVEYAPLRPMFA